MLLPDTFSLTWISCFHFSKWINLINPLLLGHSPEIRTHDFQSQRKPTSNIAYSSCKILITIFGELLTKSSHTKDLHSFIIWWQSHSINITNPMRLQNVPILYRETTTRLPGPNHGLSFIIASSCTDLSTLSITTSTFLRFSFSLSTLRLKTSLSLWYVSRDINFTSEDAGLV